MIIFSFIFNLSSELYSANKEMLINHVLLVLLFHFPGATCLDYLLCICEVILELSYKLLPCLSM